LKTDFEIQYFVNPFNSAWEHFISYLQWSGSFLFNNRTQCKVGLFVSLCCTTNAFEWHTQFNTFRAAWFRRFSQKKTAVFGCLTNTLAPPPIALESCSAAQTDQPV